MAKLIIQIPDQFYSQVIDAICVKYNYPKKSEVTKDDFAQTKLGEMLREITIDNEMRKAKASVEADIRAKITFTGFVEKPVT